MASISICRHWQAVLFLQVCSRLFIAAREIITAISVTVVQHHHRVQLLKFATFCAADTLALLLTDVLVFLQEKDQRFIFAAVVSLKLHSALESEARSQALGPFLSIPQPACHGYLLLFSPPGPEASCDSPAEADRPRGGQRGERNVPDLRLLGGPGDVRGSHRHPRREERLDEAHTAGRGEVRARRRAQRIHFLFVLLRVRAPLIITPAGLLVSCPEEEEEERCAETEEARRAAEVRVQKLTKFQGK